MPPSKVLIEAANAYHRRKSFAEFGIRGAEHLAADIPAVLLRVRRLRDDFVRGTLKATDDLGERAGSVPTGSRSMAASCARVISLSPPARARLCGRPWRALGERVLTSDTLFEQETLPARMVVIGVGAIGNEIAQALSRLGVEVAGFDGANGRGPGRPRGQCRGRGRGAAAARVPAAPARERGAHRCRGLRAGARRRCRGPWSTVTRISASRLP